MNINEFADLNVERCYSPEAKAKWGDTSKRDLTDWALCLAGEAGELCNAVKKQQMYIKPGALLETTHQRDEIIKEAADVITYAVLLLRHLGVTDVEAALMAKFDEVSARIGWKSEVLKYVQQVCAHSSSYYAGGRCGICGATD